MNENLKKTIAPITDSPLSLSEQRMALHQMFVAAVTNAPDDEVDNFTANQLAPAYLAFCQLLENVEKLN